MGETELKRALQREGEEQIRGFWQNAEAGVAARREETAAELAQLRAETDHRLQTEGTQLRNDLLFAARTRAMECRLHAEAALEECLRRLGQQMLPELAGGNQASIWEALRAELPAADWAALRVHPADRERARRAFPAAAIEDDAALGGGLVATCADTTLRVDNSLACRLLRAWPDLLPQLLAELRELVENDETAHSDTTG
jgi:vacuolar-type H+-ATPase subunit E/Vma4